MTRVVFDLDGTLIDSAPDIHLSVNLMLEERGLPPLDLQTVISFIGNGIPILVQRVMLAREVNLAYHEEWLRGVSDYYKRVNAGLTQLYPGVRESLEQLRTAGHTLALCTNKPQQLAREIVAAFDLSPLFSQIVGGDSLPQYKPDPAMLHACLSDRSGIFIGDSEVDAETARRAAVPFALFRNGYRKTPIDQIPHSAGFDDFHELNAIIEILTSAPQ